MTDEEEHRDISSITGLPGLNDIRKWRDLVDKAQGGSDSELCGIKAGTQGELLGVFRRKNSVEESKKLTFDHINSGAQVYLSDGSVWRADLKSATSAQLWDKGDPVVVSEKSDDSVWRFSITNLRLETSVSALPSSSLK